MACDPNTLLAQSACLKCIPDGMMQAVQVSLLCQILDAGGGGGGGGGVSSFNARTGAVTLTLGDVSAVADSRYVLNTGDTMTGLLDINLGVEAVGPGSALAATAIYDDGGSGEDFSLIKLKVDTSSANYLTARAIHLVDGADALLFSVNGEDGSVLSAGTLSSGAINVYTTPLTSTGLKFTANGVGVGFFGTGGTAKQTSGANLTNNVTVGGVNDTIADFTSLTVYATDAPAIRNDIYQLARKVKQINDGLRTYGLFT